MAEAMTREALFQEVCEVWQRTEDAIAALGEHFEAPCSGDWTVGDAFRHLTAASHIMSGRIRALLVTGELPFPGDSGNAEGVEKFRSLDYKMLRIELNTAHGVVWMYIQRFSDEDLAQTFTIFDEEHTLGEVIQARVLHETGHVNEALEALGLPESVIVPVETAHRWA
ncbi:MAG: DinB family protein [Chloroflexota bacterium]|nr:DinB family protein [Chloroflexota bacterium]